MKRNIGLDILRIIAMFMVVFLHVLGKGKFISDNDNANLYSCSKLLCINYRIFSS